MAILVQTLIGYGALIGGGPHVEAGDVRHGTNLSAVIVGETSRARKGTSLAPARKLWRALDDHFAATRIMGGFGSGEARSTP